ncbi:putative heterokaryon incompatibility protein [Rosellinia necatrix]|uniref:Putative heterokaryon incompatibility protein n=1 Tax=Rosellinia necatrix TaxID=77044 RepID=A0A1S8A7E7_ROSNE|nr:putative heterokaryon incompatibility protein [Rosellinia necatrix]
MRASELSKHAHSDQAYQFIRSCLDRCLDLHPNCVQPRGHPPSRLIDVGLSSDDRVRLVETSPQSRNEYIALSYCWGDVDVVRTTASNYEAMKTEIRVSILPGTIQDAITVTRNLGRRYLWVDALCIIQDSKLDWEIESANMASIYRSSLLTLAAATAAAASDGFLGQEHNASEAKPPYQQVWRNEDGHETILAARVVPEFESHTEDADEEEVLPWSLRGWTLQEQKLSTRTIGYRRRELWWSCLSASSCECHIIDELPEDVKRFCFNPTYSITVAKQMYREWHNTVREYTMRALRYSSDRLPAIAGVARVVQDLTESAYIAGLWKGNLVHDLTWEVAELGEVEARSSVARSADYLGPTFSWVSVDRHVNYEWTNRWVKATQCHLLAAESLVTGLNPLGHVESAHLTISAPLLESVLWLRARTIEVTGFSSESYLISCGDQELQLRADVALETFDGTHQDGTIERSVRRSRIPRIRAESETPISLLYLGHFLEFEHPRTKNLHVSRTYLVLGKCPTDMARYERVGIAKQDCVIHKDSSEMPPFYEGFSVNVITIV